MFKDLFNAIRDPKSWVYPAWLSIAVQYRKSYVGWLWMLAGPAVFVFIVGPLFGRFSKHDPDFFIPYLTCGMIIFQYSSGILTGSTSLYKSNKNLLLQGKRFYSRIPLIFIVRKLLNFLVTSLLIICVLFIYEVSLTSHIIYLLPGLLLIIIHSLWVSIVFGVLGARFHDVGEAIAAIMRVAFLATPIIWIPSDVGRGAVVGAYLMFNPFYHAMEPIRGAILGYPAPTMSWVVSSVAALIGMIVAATVYKRYSQHIVMWT
ncbi:ABC transporter permease [Pseudomonadota bacterium]